jgi:hypothetical protein
MFHFLAKLTVLRFRRHLQTPASDIEQPTVIWATQAAVLDIAVFQGGAAMRAVLAEQPDLAKLVAEQNQILAEHFDGLGNIMKLVSRADGNPIAAKPFAARGPWSYMGNIGECYTLSLSFCA